MCNIHKKHEKAYFLLFTIFWLTTVFFLPAGIANDQKAGSDANTAEPNEPEEKPKRPAHDHPAFKERTRDRTRMVRRQIQRRGVKDPNTIKAMLTVPRHAFVRPRDIRSAYDDRPLPIGLGQTISQPFVVAYMTEILKIDPNDKVLEIGTGSGYQAAVCAEIAAEVFSIEIIDELADSAKERLAELGYENVVATAGDGYFGSPDEAPFDSIIVTAAAGIVPPPLIEQLKPGGRMVIPLGSPYGSQSLVLIVKDKNGKIRSQNLMGVRFVPMTGEVMKKSRR